MGKINIPINGQEHLELTEDAATPDTPAADIEPAVHAAQEPAPQETPVADARDQQILKLTAERDELLARIARMQAEYDNARKRTVREQADFRDYAVTDAVNQLIPVLDNFDLASRNAATANADDLRKGIELIRKQLESNLEKLGVTTLSPEGQPFDPRFHEAIEMVDTTDAPDNAVITVLQRGYKIKERLLRPAMVRVARNSKS